VNDKDESWKGRNHDDDEKREKTKICVTEPSEVSRFPCLNLARPHQALRAFPQVRFLPVRACPQELQTLPKGKLQYPAFISCCMPGFRIGSE
jgi:hypothetical protein